ncbi:hypothetical protein QBC39DRAFT_347427 [Podospora conica]|nr:hypothetical protein QBC39DRAFT_347427 [Schizothecium conicum]
MTNLPTVQNGAQNAVQNGTRPHHRTGFCLCPRHLGRNTALTYFSAHFCVLPHESNWDACLRVLRANRNANGSAAGLQGAQRSNAGQPGAAVIPPRPSGQSLYVRLRAQLQADLRASSQPAAWYYQPTGLAAIGTPVPTSAPASGPSTPVSSSAITEDMVEPTENPLPTVPPLAVQPPTETPAPGPLSPLDPARSWAQVAREAHEAALGVRPATSVPSQPQGGNGGRAAHEEETARPSTPRPSTPQPSTPDSSCSLAAEPSHRPSRNPRPNTFKGRARPCTLASTGECEEVDCACSSGEGGSRQTDDSSSSEDEDEKSTSGLDRQSSPCPGESEEAEGEEQMEDVEEKEDEEQVEEEKMEDEEEKEDEEEMEEEKEDWEDWQVVGVD